MQNPQARAGERPADAYPQIADDLQAGRLDQAEQSLLQLLSRHPREAFAHYQMGRCQRARGNLPAAIGAYRRAIALAPELAEAHTSLGNALRASGQLHEAIEAQARAAQLQPRLPQAHLNLANALFASGQPAAAARAYSQALSLQPGWDKARRGMLIAQAASYLNEGRWSDAEQAHRRLVGEYPDSPPLWFGLGLAAWERKQPAAALEAFEQALAIDPAYLPAAYHRAFVRLMQGDYAGGYADFELRFTPGFVYPQGRPSFAMPAWQGEDLQQRHLLVWTEQGMGDALQFVRYLPLLSERGLRHLSVRVHGGLERLLQASFPQLDVAGASVATTLPADFECPLLSLPLRLDCSHDLRAATVPYLQAPQALQGRWAERLGPRQRPRIGLAWAGHPGQARNRLRSVPLARLSELTAHFAGRCDFHVLQKGEGLAELDGLDAPLLRSSDGCEDFADTAALIGQLDLVITVDTSVAHLAGGLGHPCWILLAHVPDWRYGPAGEQCGWYPQARLFRQETDGDWQGVLERVRRALEDWLVQA